jgi:predicted lipid-binding transport protein (Tim44 family)
MYGQLIELAIFGIIAFLIINKLLSSLGSTSEDDPAKTQSFFGENGQIKDVTAKTSVKDVVSSNDDRIKASLKDFILKGQEKEIQQGLEEALEKLPNFNIKNFMSGAKTAFKMILTAADKNNEEEIKELVDKRYLNQFLQIASSYVGNNLNDSVQAQISEIYTFGNNVFIKILFIGTKILKNNELFQEEWTFSKNSLESSPNWYLNNIDKSH